MSVQLIAWALEQRTGSATRKSVLLTLANATNGHTGLCCPSLTRLSEETELSRSTVKRALDDLEAAGFIARVNRARDNGSKSSNEYQFPRVTVNLPQVQGEPSPRVTVNPLEPEVRTRTEPTTRKRNEIWDTLTHMFGEPATPSATRGRGKVCAELKAAGATPDQLLQRGRNWPSHFDSATLTEHALVKHWHTLARKPLRRRS